MVLPVVPAGFAVFCCEPETAVVFCLVTVLRVADVPPDDFTAVTLLLDELLPTVPRLVLELVPMPRLIVVLSASVKTRESPCVSYLGVNERFVEMCPPCPSPGPPCP